MSQALVKSLAAKSELKYAIGIGNTQIDCKAGDGTKFPSVYPYYLIICDTDSARREVVKVSARSTDAFTVTRGSLGTTAVAHPLADPVELAYRHGEIIAPYAENYNVLTVGSVSNEVGSGVIVADSDRTILVCADDNDAGGAAATSLNIARFRLLMVSGPFQGEQYALHGTVKYIGAALSSYGAGVLGTMEWATSISITGYQGGVMARVGGSGTTTVNDFLCGMISTLNLGVTQGGSGKSVAYMVNEVSTYNWDVGLYIDDGAADIGIQMIGCTDAIICGANGDDGGDVSLYGATSTEVLKWDSTLATLDITSVLAAADIVQSITITDSGNMASGRGIGQGIYYTMTGTKTGTYGVRSSRINTFINADVHSVIVADWYMGTISDRTIGWLMGLSMYWEDYGNAVVALAMIDLGINSPHDVSGYRHAFMRCREHTTVRADSTVLQLEGNNAAAFLVDFDAPAGSANGCLVASSDNANVSYGIKVRLRAEEVTKYIHLHDS